MFDVFIDETGSVVLNSPDTESPLYISVAIIIDSGKVPAVMESLESIATEHMKKAEFKSSRIGKNSRQRSTLLKEIANLDFQFIAQVTNKNLLRSSVGLSYHSSFYKCINKKLYSRIEKIMDCEGMNFHVDTYGWKEYQESVKEFLAKYKPNLFPKANISFEEARTNRCIQLADFIAGTINRILLQKDEKEFIEEWRIILKGKEIDVLVYPFRFYRRDSECSEKPQNEDDSSFRDTLLKFVVGFIEENLNSEDDIIGKQVFTLQYLLSASYQDQPDVFSDDIMKSMNKEFGDETSKQVFITKVIGGLRNKGIIITGSSKGYKIALSLSDIQEYLDHDKHIIEPMLYRIQQARSVIKGNFSHDILASSDYVVLKKILDYIETEKTTQLLQREDVEVE